MPLGHEMVEECERETKEKRRRSSSFGNIFSQISYFDDDDCSSMEDKNWRGGGEREGLVVSSALYMRGAGEVYSKNRER